MSLVLTKKMTPKVTFLVLEDFYFRIYFRCEEKHGAVVTRVVFSFGADVDTTMLSEWFSSFCNKCFTGTNSREREVVVRVHVRSRRFYSIFKIIFGFYHCDKP